MDGKMEKCIVCANVFLLSDVIHLNAMFASKDSSRTIAEALVDFANVELCSVACEIDEFICRNSCIQRLAEGVEFQELVRNVCKKLAEGVESHAFSDDHDDGVERKQQQTTSIEIEELYDWDDKSCGAVPSSETAGAMFDIQILSSEPEQPSPREEKGGKPFVQPEAKFIAMHMKFQNFEYFELRGHRCCGCDFIAKTAEQLLEHSANSHPSRHASGRDGSADPSYVCHVCKTVFETDHKLDAHRQDSQATEVFLCKCCGLGFDTKHALTQHTMQYFSEENDDTMIMHEVDRTDNPSTDFTVEELDAEEPSRGGNAGKENLIEDQFVTHQEDYDEYRILHTEAERCCRCGKFFENYDKMLAHATAAHPRSKALDSIANCTCEACGESFKSTKSLKHHRAANSSFKKIFFCKLCKTSFVRIHLLARHILSSMKHRSKGNAANILDKRHDEQLEAILRQKSSTVRDYNGFGCCFVRCGATFDARKQLQNHVDELHAVRRRIHISDRSSNLHVCDVCQLSFKTEQSLQRHRYGWQMRKVNICSYCGKGFPNPGVLREHEQVEHTDTVPQFECEQCGKRFKKKSLLKLHLVTHQEDRRFGCDQCAARFRFGHQLKKHQKAVHATMLPYECKYCERKMANKERYDQHMRKHTGERPYECRHGCSRMFSHTTDRRRHEMVSHTGEKPHSCPSCEQAYVRKRELQLHFQKYPDHNVETGEHAFDLGMLKGDPTTEGLIGLEL